MSTDLTESLKNLVYKEENIGQMLKISKKHFTWKFDYKYDSYTIEMQDSRLSGKKRIFMNGTLVKQVEE